MPRTVTVECSNLRGELLETNEQGGHPDEAEARTAGHAIGRRLAMDYLTDPHASDSFIRIVVRVGVTSEMRTYTLNDRGNLASVSV